MGYILQYQTCPIVGSVPAEDQWLTLSSKEIYGTSEISNLLYLKEKTGVGLLASNPVLLEAISTVGDRASIEWVGSSIRGTRSVPTGGAAKRRRGSVAAVQSLRARQQKTTGKSHYILLLLYF